MQHKNVLPSNPDLIPYLQVFHYSSEHNLDTIDPSFYGTSVLRTKEREGGVNKTYFYTVDQPESCVASGFKKRYEVYIPNTWKNLIYDIGSDAESLYNKAYEYLKLQLMSEGREPYDYQINDCVQSELKNLGYKGFTNSSSALPHVVALFDPVSTKKPVQYSIIYDWSGNIIENSQKTSVSSSPMQRFNLLAVSSAIPVIDNLSINESKKLHK